MGKGIETLVDEGQGWKIVIYVNATKGQRNDAAEAGEREGDRVFNWTVKKAFGDLSIQAQGVNDPTVPEALITLHCHYKKISLEIYFSLLLPPFSLITFPSLKMEIFPPNNYITKLVQFKFMARK